VSLSLAEGDRLGIVGESGSGKSTIARAVIGLQKPSAGTLSFRGAAYADASIPAIRRHIQMVFQDPASSLNPRLPIWLQVSEPAYGCLGMKDRRLRRERAAASLTAVGLGEEALDRLPHAFSGGQRQRIAIARALAVDPALIVADEPMSSLDVSSQAEIASLFERLVAERHLSLLLISHDLSAVARLTHRVIVLYLGRVVEDGPSATVLKHPAHPYTRALLDAAPRLADARGRKRIILSGDPPSPVHPPSGCVFHPRCPLAADRCRVESPSLENIGTDHRASCFFATRPPTRD
jgi:oligopeptide/dipeptide ABC transporter ATP-binding protein